MTKKMELMEKLKEQYKAFLINAQWEFDIVQQNPNANLGCRVPEDLVKLMTYKNYYNRLTAGDMLVMYRRNNEKLIWQSNQITQALEWIM